MPAPSRTISNLLGHGGCKDGWEVFYRAREMKAAGRPVIELTIGEHDVLTDPQILDAMDASAQGGALGYAAVPGIDTLRTAIADRVTTRTGVPTSADNILVTPGGQAALFAAFKATCDPGHKALIIDPYYATYPGTVRAVGAVPAPVPAPAERNFQPDPATVSDAAHDADALLINTPNNPTGVVYSKDTLAGIAEVCTRHDLWLISDEVYDTQVWSGSHISPRALPGMAERTLVVGSMSKSHAMTGSRLGWIVGPRNLIKMMTDLATHTTYGVAGFIQEASVHALSLGPDFEDRIAAPFRRRRDMVVDRLKAQQLVGVVPATGAMYVMLDIRKTGLSGQDFADALLDATGVAVMPGESFGEAAAGHLRVALTQPDEVMADALDRILDFAKSLPDLRRHARCESA